MRFDGAKDGPERSEAARMTEVQRKINPIGDVHLPEKPVKFVFPWEQIVVTSRGDQGESMVIDGFPTTRDTLSLAGTS
jgi:hypothetical protein